MINVFKIGILVMGVLACSCGEKNAQSVTESEETVNPVIITNDVARDPDSLKFRTSALVYDAAGLPLGENYTSAEQLEKATLIAKLTNISHSAQSAKIDEQSCLFSTEMILGEDLKTVDLETEIAVNDMQMKFFSSLRLGSSGYYELSQSGDSNRMYVVVLSVEKIENEPKK